MILPSSFVVETQPSMPQGKGPLVLRTNVQFSVKTRSVLHHVKCFLIFLIFMHIKKRFESYWLFFRVVIIKLCQMVFFVVWFAKTIFDTFRFFP